MQPFTTLTAIAASLPLINVDTDMIIPKQFLKTIKRSGLGQFLFYEMRFDMEENENADFILNQAPFRQANILISGKNFGCGSSREHAPWAIVDFGIRAIIAPSFADIFYNNCTKNGILPISLPEEVVDQLTAQVTNDQGKTPFHIDLEAQTVTDLAGKVITFDIAPAAKHHLLEGLDDIELTLKKGHAIDKFEQQSKQTYPWLYHEGWTA